MPDPEHTIKKHLLNEDSDIKLVRMSRTKRTVSSWCMVSHRVILVTINRCFAIVAVFLSTNGVSLGGNQSITLRLRVCLKLPLNTIIFKSFNADTQTRKS